MKRRMTGRQTLLSPLPIGSNISFTAQTRRDIGEYMHDIFDPGSGGSVGICWRRHASDQDLWRAG